MQTAQTVINCTVIGTKPGQRVELPFKESQTVDDLKSRVEKAFKIPKATIRLLFCGKELKPMYAKLSNFNVGRYGNFIIHMSTSTVELGGEDVTNVASAPKRPRSTEMIDLTNINPTFMRIPPLNCSTSCPIDLTEPAENSAPVASASGIERANSDSDRRRHRRRRLQGARSDPVNVFDLCESDPSDGASVWTSSRAADMIPAQMPPATPSMSVVCLPSSVRADPSVGGANSISSGYSNGQGGSKGLHAISGGELSRAARLRISRALHHRLYLLQHTFEQVPPSPASTGNILQVANPSSSGSSSSSSTYSGSGRNGGGDDVLRCLVQGAGGAADRHNVTIGQTCYCDCDDDFRPSRTFDPLVVHGNDCNRGNGGPPDACNPDMGPGSSGCGGMFCKHVIFVLLKVLRAPLSCPLIQSGHISAPSLRALFQGSGFLRSATLRQDLPTGDVPSAQAYAVLAEGEAKVGETSEAPANICSTASHIAQQTVSETEIPLGNHVLPVPTSPAWNAGPVTATFGGGGADHSDGMEIVAASSAFLSVPRRRAVVIDLGDLPVDSDYDDESGTYSSFPSAAALSFTRPSASPPTTMDQMWSSETYAPVARRREREWGNGSEAAVVNLDEDGEETVSVTSPRRSRGVGSIGAWLSNGLPSGSNSGRSLPYSSHITSISDNEVTSAGPSSSSAVVSSFLRMAAAEEAKHAAIASSALVCEKEAAALETAAALAERFESERREAERQAALEHECPICFERIYGKEAAVNCKKCHNALHLDCLKQWQKQSKTCPFCRHKWPTAPNSRKKSPSAAARAASGAVAAGRAVGMNSARTGRRGRGRGGLSHRANIARGLRSL